MLAGRRRALPAPPTTVVVPRRRLLALALAAQVFLVVPPLPWPHGIHAGLQIAPGCHGPGVPALVHDRHAQGLGPRDRQSGLCPPAPDHPRGPSEPSRPDGPTTSGELDAGLEEDTVLALLSQLPPRQRQVMAFAFDGYTPKETAISLGIPAGTVRLSLHKARATLAAQLTTRDLSRVPTGRSHDWPVTVAASLRSPRREEAQQPVVGVGGGDGVGGDRSAEVGGEAGRGRRVGGRDADVWNSASDA